MHKVLLIRVLPCTCNSALWLQLVLIKKLQYNSQADGSSSLPRNGTEEEPELRTCVTKEYLPLRTIPVTVKSGHKSLCTNALLDDGSTRSYINEGVADCLGLKDEPVSLNVPLLNDTTANLKSGSVQFDM